MKANLLGASALLLASFGLSACVEDRMIPAPANAPDRVSRPAPRPTYQPPSRPAYQPASPPANTWADLPATPGDWRWSQEGGQSVARFAAGRLTLRCDVAARSVRIERMEPGTPTTGPATLTVRTQTQTRSFSAVPQAGALSVSLGARDPLLDAMAFSRGRFAVEGGGMPALLVPSWTEVSRVIEDCR